MKKIKNIHNLNSLKREIYRLQGEAKNIEEKLDRNFERLEENFPSMVMNSFFHKKRNKEDEKDSYFSSFLKNERINAVVNKITGHITDGAEKKIDELMNKIFNKKKPHTEE
jgi:hypothetical protein